MAIDFEPILTPRLRLHHAEPGQSAAHVAFFARNQASFRPWQPPRPHNFLTEAYWQEQLARALGEWAAGESVRLVLLPRDDLAATALVGRIQFTQIARGPFCSAILGYELDHAHQGRGLMREALLAAVGHMFDVQKLHRIEANVRPENARSLRLLERLGFQRIGLAPQYLFIDGQWRDHLQHQLINQRFDDSALRAGRV